MLGITFDSYAGESFYSDKMPRFVNELKEKGLLEESRGAQVVEDDLCKVLADRSDITALLDVTWPEPPVEGHPFYSLKNCILTPHIAGSAGMEVFRMSEYMVNEYNKYIAGEKTQYEVSLKMLKTMA